MAESKRLYEQSSFAESCPAATPKMEDVHLRPGIVDEEEFEESNIVDARARSHPARVNVFDPRIYIAV